MVDPRRRVGRVCRGRVPRGPRHIRGRVMDPLDVPAPLGECGYAYVAPDAMGVLAWWRCSRDYGHTGSHATDTPTDDNTRRGPSRRVSS